MGRELVVRKEQGTRILTQLNWGRIWVHHADAHEDKPKLKIILRAENREEMDLFRPSLDSSALQLAPWVGEDLKLICREFGLQKH